MVGLAERSVIRNRDTTLTTAGNYVCLVEATDYQQECPRSLVPNDYGEIPPDSNADTCVLDQIAQERDCPAFYRFQPGRTPKEHLEARDSDRQREDNRQWEWRKSVRVALVSASVGGTFGGVLVPLAAAWLRSAGFLP